MTCMHELAVTALVLCLDPGNGSQRESFMLLVRSGLPVSLLECTTSFVPHLLVELPLIPAAIPVVYCFMTVLCLLASEVP